MLREHAPLIALSTVIAIMFYLVFRDLRSLHKDVGSFQAVLSGLGATLSAPRAPPPPPGSPGSPGPSDGEEADVAGEEFAVPSPLPTERTERTERPSKHAATKRKGLVYDGA